MLTSGVPKSLVKPLALILVVAGFNFLFSIVAIRKDDINYQGTRPLISLLSIQTSEQSLSNEILFLKKEDASSVLKKEEILSKIRTSPYSIDILIVGSKNNTEQSQVQRDTWASHEAVRHFFLSTEDDDTNSRCGGEEWSNDELVKYMRPCRKKGSFWRRINGENKFTNYLKVNFARFKWLKRKKSASGWLCAQKRFATSFTSVVQIYAETQSLPDYFIVADDDTYINIENIVKMLIQEPANLERKGENQTTAIYPSSESPLVLAGCRIRTPNHKLTWTVPFGGYGTFFSKGSLKRLIQPLYCNENSLEFERDVCNKLLNKESNDYPVNATIAEEKFFEIGDSVNQVFYKYSRDIEHFCLHSDWFMGYLANFYNISRHTVRGTGNYFEDRKMNVQESRLHSFENSEIYTIPEGQCSNSPEFGSDCGDNATVCHRMTIDAFRTIHSKITAENK